MPTILQILPRLNSGGVERGTIEIAKAITSKGYNSIVVSQGGNLVPLLTKSGSMHIELNAASKNPFTIYKNARRLKKIINDYNVDIVHARSRAPAWSAYLATRNSNANFITTFHGVYSGQSYLKKRYNSVMLRGKKIITVSNFISKHIEENYNFVNTNQISCIHRGVDINHFNKKTVRIDKIQEYINRWNIPDDKRIILMPARITEWKGHEFLLNGLSKLNRDDYHCLMVGDPGKHKNYRNRVESLITSLGLQDKVMIMNSISDIENLYQISSIVVSASLRPEAFGRNIVEAGAMGKIVIATNHGGAMETVIDGKTGFLVKAGDSKALAEKINHVLDLPEKKRSTIEENAKKHIVNNFSITRMQQRTIDLYNSLLTSSKTQDEGNRNFRTTNQD